MATTQTRHPWRATVRTILQAVVGLAAMAPLIYSAITQGDPAAATGWAATALGISAAVTRVMALPGVEQWLSRYLPWLAADPYVGEHREGDRVTGYWESHGRQ